MEHAHLTDKEFVTHVLSREQLSDLEAELVLRLEVALDVIHEMQEDVKSCHPDSGGR